MTPGNTFRCAAGILTAVLLLGGCSEKSETGPGPETETAMLIQPRVSVGSIHAGMTREQVVTQLGPPGRQTANALEYPKLGLAVMPDSNGVVQVVMCGDVTGVNGPFVKAFTGRTKEGIGMKSTRADVLRAFGMPTQAESMRFGLESMQYASLGLTFTLENGQVHHMIVRLGGTQPSQSISVETTPAQ